MITEQGESAMKACAQKNEDVNPGWSESALLAIERLCEARILRGGFTIEELRDETDVDPPTDMRAWGAVTMKAVKEGIIEPTGEYRPARSSHGSPKPCYRFVPRGFRK
jgi:hypothetical protein